MRLFPTLLAIVFLAPLGSAQAQQRTSKSVKLTGKVQVGSMRGKLKRARFQRAAKGETSTIRRFREYKGFLISASRTQSMGKTLRSMKTGQIVEDQVEANGDRVMRVEYRGTDFTRQVNKSHKEHQRLQPNARVSIEIAHASGQETVRVKPDGRVEVESKAKLHQRAKRKGNSVRSRAASGLTLDVAELNGTSHFEAPKK